MLVQLPTYITDPLPTQASRHLPPDHALFDTEESFWLCFVAIEGRVWGHGPTLASANEAAIEALLKRTNHTLIKAEIRITPDGSFWFCGCQELEDVCGGSRLADDLIEVERSNLPWRLETE